MIDDYHGHEDDGDFFDDYDEDEYYDEEFNLWEMYNEYVYKPTSLSHRLRLWVARLTYRLGGLLRRKSDDFSDIPF